MIYKNGADDVVLSFMNHLKVSLYPQVMECGEGLCPHSYPASILIPFDSGYIQPWQADNLETNEILSRLLWMPAMTIDRHYTPAVIPMKWSDTGTNGSMEHCACCGRKLRSPPVYVEVISGGSLIAAPGLDPDQNDSGYMGFFPVGRSCANKHFRGYTHEH